MRRLQRSLIALFAASLVAVVALAVMWSPRLAAETTAPGDPLILSYIKPRMQSFSDKEDAEFTVSITNTGPIELETVSVTNATAGDCNRNDLGALEPGESLTYTCERKNVSNSFLNELQVNGTAEGKPPATHRSNAYVKVWTDQIRVYKEPKVQLISQGEQAEFVVTLFNTSNFILTVDEVDDDLVDDCDVNPTLTVTILPQQSINFPCFEDDVKESMTTIITFRARNPFNNNTYTATDAAWVDLLAMEATLTPSTTSMPEPGDEVVFTVDLVNAGRTPVTPTSLITDKFGDLRNPSNPQIEASTNTCLGPLPKLPAPGSSYSCSFVAQVNGQPPSFTVNLTATGDGPASMTTTAVDTATITLENLPASMSLTLGADPSFINPPGRLVIFNIHIENSSEADAIAITELEDEFLGDLNGEGTCNLPAEGILPGGSYNCSFADYIEGEIGEQITREITAQAISDDTPPDILSVTKSVTVGITDQPGRDIYLPNVADDTVEPNDQCLRAYPLTIDRQYYFLPPDQYNSNIPTEQRDQDYFTFVLTQDRRVRIDLTNFAPQKGQLIIRPHIEEANPPCGSNSISRHLISAPNHQFQVDGNAVLEEGRYYIQLINDGPSNVLTYYGLKVHVELP